MLKILLPALTKMFNTEIIHADYQTKPLQGGTLGDVKLITGSAQTTDEKKLPFTLVLKLQKKWERPGDPDSWRREYDLYTSDFAEQFTDSFRWPVCYFAEIEGDQIQLVLEYIDGASGSRLTLEHLEYASEELGRFHGKIHRKAALFQPINCLSDTGFIEREHAQWHTQTLSYELLISETCNLPDFMKEMIKNKEIPLHDGKSFEYSCLRASVCDLPIHLKQMLIDIDDHREAVFQKIKRLPVVLCHRDFWIENIFFANKKIRLIDWDGAGWGYLCEDMASLIVDDTDPDLIDEYYRRLVPAYFRGLSEYMDVSSIEDLYIREMIILKFGYRILQSYMFTLSPDIKKQQITALQKIYEMSSHVSNPSK